jgi:hypothetical protein
VRKLAKHPILGCRAMALIKNFQKATFVDLICKWKGSVSQGDVDSVLTTAHKFYTNSTKPGNHFVIDQDFIDSRGLDDLVEDTTILLGDKGKECAVLVYLEGKLAGHMGMNQVEDLVHV